MDKYTIYCTEEQTKKALELGAPIAIYGNGELSETIAKKYNLIPVNGVTYIISTAEQMIGWLEEKRISVDLLTYFSIDNSKIEYYVYTVTDPTRVFTESNKTRKEATLAAIDVALDYLIDIKKK